MSDIIDDKETGNSTHPPDAATLQNLPRARKGPRFWLIFFSLNVSLFLAALELTAVSTALPTIASALHAQEFVWVGSAYALASTSFLPMSGALAEIFGRRPSLLTCIGLFFVGSAICGAAKNMPTMIAGRTVQGLGGGGIQSVSAIILSDMVSLEERGVYASIFGVTWSIASFIGPIVGGALASAGAWRWLFYMNLPIGGFATIVTLLFMSLPTPPGSLYGKLIRMDWIGNLLIISSTASCTIALTWGGVTFPWNSWHVLVPLVLGLCGIVFFLVYESRWATNPLVPKSVLSNRTSLSGYLQTFFVGVIAIGVVYFVPVYFQACKDASPVESGVICLSLASLAPAAIFAGVMVKRTSRYRPQMWTGWALIMIGFGLMSIIHASSSRGSVVGFLLILGVGLGFEYSTTVFPVQAPLPVSLNAPALAFLMFSRSFAAVWGVTIGSTVLQNELKRKLAGSAFLEQFPQGVTVAYAIIPTIKALPEPLKTTVRNAFADSLQILWYVSLGIAGLGALSSLIMRGLPLPSYTDEKWAIKE